MIKKYRFAHELPPEWDELAGENIYLTRDFLMFLESAQKTEMQYVGFFDANKLDSCIVHHKSRFDLNMFTDKKPSKKLFNNVYLPASVSRPSIIVGEKTKPEVEKYLKSLKGWSCVINTDSSLNLKGFYKGYTCPRCVMRVRFKTMEEYLESLRSGYRRRYNIALKKSSEMKIEILPDNNMFDDELYKQYLQVLDNSRIRLERLEPDFFKDKRFVIFTASFEDKKIGFLQLLENGDELIFEFIGFEHSLNAEFDIYHRFLFEIVRYGIEKGFKTIDFGQTADDAKLKLGCGYEFLYTHLRHSNPIINLGIKLKIKKMQYRFNAAPAFKVFKEKET